MQFHKTFDLSIKVSLFYLLLHIHFDGEKDITFNVVHIDNDKQLVVVASSSEGKISVLEYEIKEDCDGEYFEYGHLFEKIYFDDFEEV